MHITDPQRLPDIETGLHLVRWKVPGFEWMRREHLLDPKRRFGLVDGLVLHRSDHSQRHDRVVAELARRLAEADVNEQLEVTIDRELRFETLDAVVTPDIVVSRGLEVPSLIVEVSDHAPRLDSMEKARLYGRAGIEQYWHIDLAWTMLDVHSHPHTDGYGMRAGGPPREACPTFFAPLPELCLVELLEASNVAPRSDRSGPAEPTSRQDTAPVARLSQR
jgi:Uma2 family endonuclease